MNELDEGTRKLQEAIVARAKAAEGNVEKWYETHEAHLISFALGLVVGIGLGVWLL